MSGFCWPARPEKESLVDRPRSAPDRRDGVEFQALETKALEIFDPEKADALFHRMALFETCAVPVLATEAPFRAF
jgi:hypothetical protein